MKKKEKNITTDFEEFKRDKVKEFNRKKTFEPLSSDIEILRELEDGNIEKITEPVEIEQITGIITDKDRIKQLEESISGGPVFNADLSVKEVKRGDIIWITALLKKPQGRSWTGTQSNYAVLRCRIQDIFWGLNKLNTLK